MTYIPENKKEERNRSLIADYLSGSFTNRELEIIHGCSIQNIYRILKVYNIPAKNSKQKGVKK